MQVLRYRRRDGAGHEGAGTLEVGLATRRGLYERDEVRAATSAMGLELGHPGLDHPDSADEAVALATALTDPATCASLERRLAEVATSRGLEEVRVAAPVDGPRRLFGVGLNYRAHAAEAGLADDTPPAIFFKDWGSIIGPGDPIVLPEFDDAIDFEGELAVVIGRAFDGSSGVAPESAVAGYTIGNDVSARTVQFSTSQWSLAKSFPTFCPLGPGISPRGVLEDPQGLGLSTTVNGVEMQRASTGDLRVGVAELVAHIARHVALEAGDVILTGTPEGVGHFRSPPVYLRAGDVVEVTIEHIGTLRNEVRAPAARPEPPDR